MPIVTVEIVAGADGAVAQDLAQSLADSLGRALKSPAGQTWVRVHFLPGKQYAENDARLDAAQLPVFVTILRRTIPEPAQLEVEVAALTDAVAKVIGRAASCVHLEYAPAASGRLSFGGDMVR